MDKKIERINRRIDELFMYFDFFSEIDLINMARECLGYLRIMWRENWDMRFACKELIAKAYSKTGDFEILRISRLAECF